MLRSSTANLRAMAGAASVLCGAAFAPGSVLTPPAAAQVRFTDVTAAAGVRFWHQSGPEVPIGGGAVWADFDGDGDDDLYAAQADGCNRLYVNQGDGLFVEAPTAAGAADCASVSNGAAAADFDNDGDQDLYISNWGQNRFYRNRLVETGRPGFVDRTVAAGMADDGGGNSASAAWGDFDNDGLLDLVVVNHLLFFPWNADACLPDLVWHNNGDGTFTEVAAELGIARSGNMNIPGCGLATTWSDYDLDGDLDLMVINDFGADQVPNRLFRNDGAGGAGGWAFTDVSSASGFDFGIFGMGVSAGDFDRDGDFDYYLSNLGENVLALNLGNGTFVDVAPEADVLASDPEIYLNFGLVSWGSIFLDANGDGWEELFVANGGAPTDKWPGIFGLEYINLNPVYAYGNLRRRPFLEGHEAVGLRRETYHRSLAASDYDGDGDIDLYLGNLHGYGTLYRNDTPLDFNWLKVEAVGTESNRDAIGAKVSVTVAGDTQIREVSGGSSFLSRHTLTTWFGLADAEIVDLVRVRFPSGRVAELRDVATDQTVTVLEPQD